MLRLVRTDGVFPFPFKPESPSDEPLDGEGIS
jgi:hypothetical protein